MKPHYKVWEPFVLAFFASVLTAYAMLFVWAWTGALADWLTSPR